MTITINDNKTELPQDTTVKTLITQLYPDTKGGIAVAINNKIVPKTQWDTHKIKQDDDIVIINAAYGG